MKKTERMKRKLAFPILGVVLSFALANPLTYAAPIPNEVAKNAEVRTTGQDDYLIMKELPSGKYQIDTKEMTAWQADSMIKNKNTKTIIEKNVLVKGQSVDQPVTKNPDDSNPIPENLNKYEKPVHDKTEEKQTYTMNRAEWNLQQINADEVSDSDIAANENIKVAVIDSGIDYTEDIDVEERKNFISGDEEVSVIFEDLCGHGTSVAGVLAAKDNEIGITGIAPGVKLYSARVLDGNMSAPVSRAVEGIYWAIEKDVDIINISFSTKTDSLALKTAIEDAAKAGILIVAAAGNDGTIEYPAAYPDVIAVGSVDTKGDICDFSAPGDEVELVAPGEQIKSTSDFGGLSIHSGTSMSAPHVAGIAATLWAKDPSVDADFIRALLDASANLYGNQTQYGYGLIDLDYANQIYDDFKVAYQNAPNGRMAEVWSVADNTKGIKVFDDVDYVEGVWSKDNHESLVDDGYNLLDSEIRAIKCGARRSDELIAGMTAYPQWHGYWQKKTAPTGGSQVYKSNYMASYLYISMLAANVTNNTNTTIVINQPSIPNGWKDINSSGLTSSYTSSADYNAIKKVVTNSKFNSTPWSDVLVLNGKNLVKNNRKVKFYLYGAALHTVTDMFAHDSYDENGKYISHSDNKADSVSFKPNRFACASYMADTLLTAAVFNEPGSIEDFLDVVSEKYDGSFRLANYSLCAQAISSTYYSNNSALFDRINISK